MANYAWFANSADMTVTVGATTFSVAALKNVSFTPRYEIAELYGMESTHVQARAKYALKVDVGFEYAMWDCDNDYVLGSVLNGEYSITTPATDDDTASLRNKCALFNVTATHYDSTRSRKITATAYNVVFPEIPYEMRENEYISRNMRGTGESVAFATGTP
jgi:hypothetical protein